MKLLLGIDRQSLLDEYSEIVKNKGIEELKERMEKDAIDNGWHFYINVHCYEYETDTDCVIEDEIGTTITMRLIDKWAPKYSES